LGRVKWWRETILKKRLKGETARAGFKGPYFFRLQDHLTRGLWPPTSEDDLAAQQADDSETRPAPEDKPCPTPMEALHESLRYKVHSMASMASMASTVDSMVLPSVNTVKNASMNNMYSIVDHPIELMESMEAMAGTDRDQGSTVDSMVPR